MKTLGIIGGMGPMATVDLMRKIILSTDAKTDQEHIHILVDNNPQIPDRTAAIEGRGESPVEKMLQSAKLLEAQGADVLVIACNTAHYFLDEFKDKVNVPIINMIDEAVKHCVELGYSEVGLLCTTGTRNTGIYQKACDKFNLKLVVPDDEEIKALQDMIYLGVKANNFNYDSSNVKQVISTMRNRGAQAFILGCTETPIAVQMYHLEGNFIDSSLVLAHKAIEAVEAPLIKSHAVT
ncbi:aspartate/glutamate racemase family protein [Succinivibrio dextrinosolvens]|uniref:Aspartate racemase n=1 Tax=Succinivibrio dextrinosolvens TaxID=83771 RepID=A0A662ZBQ4_9GAMM|nr:amino acid racemase [Succinivibrio dextrinosolvens]SFK35332.1 aspartate racemase [Succinivibrio dextrinosolvens]